MYSKLTVIDKVRVPPHLFGKPLNEALQIVIQNEYEGTLTKEDGVLIMLNEIKEIGQGSILPEDGAVYYETTFEMLGWEPLSQEVIEGRITEVREFGVFVRMGAIDGLVHMSQVMDDFVSYSKGGIIGKSSKETVKLGDEVRARVIAVSMKTKENSKIGLTMRQPGLGRVEKIKNDFGEKKETKKAEKKTTAGKKK